MSGRVQNILVENEKLGRLLLSEQSRCRKGQRQREPLLAGNSMTVMSAVQDHHQQYLYKFQSNHAVGNIPDSLYRIHRDAMCSVIGARERTSRFQEAS